MLGYTAGATMNNGLLHENTFLLNKMFARSELAKAVQFSLRT